MYGRARTSRSAVRFIGLILVGLLVGGLLVSPATAHVDGIGHIWKDHIRPKADKRYLHGVVTEDSGVVTVPAGGVGEAVASCPSGTIAISGGFGTVGFDQTMQVARSASLDDATAWRIVVKNPGTGEGTIIAYATCAAVG